MFIMQQPTVGVLHAPLIKGEGKVANAVGFWICSRMLQLCVDFQGTYWLHEITIDY